MIQRRDASATFADLCSKTLRQDAFDNMAVDVSEAVVATLVEVGEAFVVHA